MTAKTLTSLCLLAAATPVLAFQPFVTDDTGTQGTGGNQLEFSYTRDRAVSPDDTATTRTRGLVFTRGFTDELDVFVQANRTSVHSTATGASSSGSGNPSFGAKWRFYESENAGLSFALKPEILMPVSAARESAGLGNGRTSHGVTFIATQEVGFGAIHANLFSGRDRFRDSLANPSVNTSRASVAPVWSLGDWQLGFDVGTERATASGVTTRTNFAVIGAVYSYSKDLDFAAGIIRNTDANGDAPATTRSLTLGVTWRF